MRKYNLYQIDSFTKTKFFGNPAGVITNADGLTDVEMQRIAREFNNSETAFIFSSDDLSAYDVHVRFFTPTHEVPICGHATIAAHYARAIENKLESARVLHRTGVGVLPVDIMKEDYGYKIVMTQGEISFGEIINDKMLDRISDALNISKSDLIGEDCPVRIASTGHSKVMIGVKSNETLSKLRPEMAALSTISSDIGCNGYYVFTINDDDILIRGRMFAPAIGINEDPVTGNANGSLGAYLVKHGLVKHDGGILAFKAMQGEAMKRAGEIDVQVKIEDGEPKEVKIAGNAVIVFRTELIFD